MPHILVFANQKGGVGKTTSAINLAASLALRGKKTILLDMDPQANASTSLNAAQRGLDGGSADDGQLTLADFLLSGRTADDIWQKLLRPAPCRNLYLAPADPARFSLEHELSRQPEPAFALKTRLATRPPPADYLVIDCPPSLSFLTLTALTAANSIIVPVQCEFLPLDGMRQILANLDDVRARLNPGLQLAGILLTMFDQRNNLSLQVAEDVRRHFGRRVFRTYIPRNVRLSEAPSHGLPCVLYDADCAGSRAYHRLAAEFLARQRAAKPAAHAA